MPKNPHYNLLFDDTDGLEFFLIFWVIISSYLPLLQKGTTATQWPLFMDASLGSEIRITKDAIITLLHSHNNLKTGVEQVLRKSFHLFFNISALKLCLYQNLPE